MGDDTGVTIKDLIASIVKFHGEESTAERAIRHYIQLDLIPPPFRKGRYARYHPDALKILRAVEHLRQHEGMGVSEIASLFKHVPRWSVIEFVDHGFDRQRLKPYREPRGTTGELMKLLFSLSDCRRGRERPRIGRHESSGIWVRVQVTENFEVGARMETRSMDESKLHMVASVLRQMIQEEEDNRGWLPE
jgi:DNA-binding transcriptional MerR regulator